MDVLDMLNNVGGDGNTLSHLRPKLDIQDALQCIRDIDDTISTEISITFRPELSARWSSTSLAHITETVLRKALKHKRKDIGIILIGEYSEVGRWHYHGMITHSSGDICNLIKRVCARELGRTEIKQISFPESYKTYMMDSYSYKSKKVAVRQEWKDSDHVRINL